MASFNPDDSAAYAPIRYNRRAFLRATAIAVPALTLSARVWAQDADAFTNRAADELAALEARYGTRLGVYALDAGNGSQIRYRADQRFPMCSTFKVILAAAVLARSERELGLLKQRIAYDKSNLVTYSPITEKHVGAGLTVAELCAAALRYSDNTAGNLLMRLVGGPTAVTAYARSIGDDKFRLDRWETRLNTAIPGDPRDTTTPASMGRDLESLLLGVALQRAQRDQLIAWMLGNTTGAKRIRAAMPANYQVADKTGAGDYGTANDIGLIYPPNRRPVIIAIYSTRQIEGAKWSDELIAEAARVVVKVSVYLKADSVGTPACRVR